MSEEEERRRRGATEIGMERGHEEAMGRRRREEATRRVESVLCHLESGNNNTVNVDVVPAVGTNVMMQQQHLAQTIGCPAEMASCSGEGRKKSCVAVLGAAGGIGQPLSLLLMSLAASRGMCHSLRLYDIGDAVRGVGADLAHIDAGLNVKAFVGESQLRDALDGADIVVIPAGVPRKPGMTRDDLFNVNAGIVVKLIEAVADICPSALIAIITNPVNSTVPIAAEVLKRKRVYDPRRLFGVTALDVMRANKFLGERMAINPEFVEVPVIGGHAGVTILPLFSQARPSCNLSQEEVRHAK